MRSRRPCRPFGVPIPSDGVPLPIEPRRLGEPCPEIARQAQLLFREREEQEEADRPPRVQVPRLLALSALLPGCGALPAPAPAPALALLLALLALALVLLISARRALQRERAGWWSWAAPLPWTDGLRRRWLTSVGYGLEPLSALDGYLERIRVATRQGSDPSVSVAERMAESVEVLGVFADAVRGLVDVHSAPLDVVVEVLRRRLAAPPAPPPDPRLPWQDPAQDGEAVHTSVGRPLPLAQAQCDEEAPTLPWFRATPPPAPPPLDEDLTQVNTAYQAETIAFDEEHAERELARLARERQAATFAHLAQLLLAERRQAAGGGR